MKTPTPITALFGGSPFKPLQQHMRVVAECVAEVPGLFQALIDGDAAALQDQKGKIFAKEEAADLIRDKLRDHLPKSLFLPVDRRDLLDILLMQDAIADTAQEIAGLLVERHMEVPERMADPLMALVKRCVDTCEQAHRIVEELDELVETGFSGREAAEVARMVEVLNEIEAETDGLGTALASRLFALEDKLNPVSVVFWYQLIRWIGDLADYSEKVGDRLRLLIAR